MPNLRLLISLALALGTAPGFALAQDARTTNTGAYTEEQAVRGQAVYEANCQRCHAASLRGTPGGPSILGNRFKNNWVGATAADFYMFVHDNMPASQPASLQDQQYADVVAYIFKKAGYPAGDAELPIDYDGQSLITIEALP